MLQSPVVFSVANIDTTVAFTDRRWIIPVSREIVLASVTDRFLDCFCCSFLLAHVVAHEVFGREQQLTVRIRVRVRVRVGSGLQSGGQV